MTVTLEERGRYSEQCWNCLTSSMDLIPKAMSRCFTFHTCTLYMYIYRYKTTMISSCSSMFSTETFKHWLLHSQSEVFDQTLYCSNIVYKVHCTFHMLTAVIFHDECENL